MTNTQIIVLIAAILLLQAIIWIVILRWMKMKTGMLKNEITKQAAMENDTFIFEPRSALYRGSDSRFGNVKGNGVICLTTKNLIFKKLTGQEIEIPISEITSATVEDWFKGKPSFATGGRHLALKTKDGNRIGFLLKDAELFADKLNAR